VALLAVLGLAAVAAWSAWPADHAPEQPRGAANERRDAPAVATADGATTTPTPSPDRAPAAPVSAPAPESVFVLRGRCITEADGTPIADATVTLRDGATRAADREPAPPLAVTTTAPDGRFTVHTSCLESLAGSITAAGFAEVTGRWRAHRPREVDVGDVRLVAATIVEGEVVTDRGQPVEGAEVILAVVTPEPPGFTTQRFTRAESAADGRFRFSEPIATGDWYAVVNNAGGLLTPRDVHVPSGVDRHFLRVTTTTPDPAQAIRGLVVDAAGAPMPKVDLRANGAGATGSAETRADGTFVLYRGGAFTNTGGDEVSLFVTEPSADHEVDGDPPRTRWGATDVRIVMRKRASTTIVVTDRTGAPRVDVDVLVAQIGRNSMTPRFVRAPGRGDGRLVVSRLGSGRHVVIGRPRDGSPPTAAVPFAVENGRGPAEVHVVVAEPAVLTVDVVDANGAAVAGSRVEAILVLAGAPPAASASVPTLATADPVDLMRQASLVVATATTDANGRAVLPLHDGDASLRVRGTLHAPVVVPATMRGEGTRVRVVVEPAGRIVGRCEPLSALAKLRAAGGDSETAIEVLAARGDTIGARSPIDANGTFSLDGLPAGTWSVQLSAPLRCNPEFTTTTAVPLGDVVVTAGTVERTFALDTALPAIASGNVTLDGAPWPRVQLSFHRERPRAHVRAVADANGRFRTLLPTGEWSVGVAFAAQPGPGWISVVVPPKWTAAADREEQRTLAARSRTVQLRVLDAANAPVANANVRIAAELGYFRPGALTTDARGIVTITHPPYGPFDLTVTAGDRELRVGPIESFDDTGTTVIDARPRPK